MAKIVEILETERKRPTAQDWDVVHMYKTGQFYTAYYWSASLNSQTNGYNLNFNASGVNPANNNNRFNGFSVRAVQHSSIEPSAMTKITTAA